MLRSPRVWLFAAGGWLLLGGVVHLAWHVWAVLLENGVEGQRAFAIGAMRQAYLVEPLAPSLWRVFRMLSASFALWLLFAGSVNVALAWTGAEARTLRAIALLGTLFWTAAFVPYAFLDPVLGALVVAGVAVPLHGIAFLTASEEASHP